MTAEPSAGYYQVDKTQIPIVQRIPWSQLGPEFAMVWGAADPANPQPEHMEVIGINGGGKTYFVCKVVQERMIVRDSPCVIICTKRQDATIMQLGWPITEDWEEVRKHRQIVFWPQTNAIGSARKEYQRRKIQDLLNRLWQPNANVIVVFDDIAYTEKLSPEMRDTIEMYWREGRSQGITVVATKQRPQGANRHMSSETYWKAAFAPADYADRERFAELFGPKWQWLPVFDQMNPDNNEFLIRHTRTGFVAISWVDEPLVPIKPPSEENQLSAHYSVARGR
jgi:hypothetical protein